MLKLDTLKDAITALAAHTATQHEQAIVALHTAHQRLIHAPDAATLRAQLTEAGERAARAAIPVTDAPLDAIFTVADTPPPGATIIGVDGSQIPPDRHAAVLYYLLQVGGLTFRYNGAAPTEHRAATLHYSYHELHDDEGQLIGVQLGMRRAVRELEYLAELVELAQENSPCIALSDGPLLWPYSGKCDAERAAYFAALTRLRAASGWPVGFIERPGGRPLLTLLELDTATAPTEPATLSDHALMAQRLPPGARSVWLKRPTNTNMLHARAGHAIWFCYLNVGAPGDPVIARIETPEWVASNPEQADRLHTLLLHQARVLGGNPYVLARAHELALVTTQDKAALEALLLRRLLEHNLVARPSEKARQKQLLGSM